MIDIVKLSRSYKISKGYEDPDGTPLICFNCDNKEFINTDEYYEDYMLVEFTLECKKCHKKLGHWAYGEWLK